MDELADQLDAQVSSNFQLRERLSQAVAKGEKEQRETSGKIEEMQKRLAGMEDSVLAAQQHSETTLTNHESEVRRIDEATSPSLQRLKIHIPDPNAPVPQHALPLAHDGRALPTDIQITSTFQQEAIRHESLGGFADADAGAEGPGVGGFAQGGGAGYAGCGAEGQCESD